MAEESLQWKGKKNFLKDQVSMTCLIVGCHYDERDPRSINARVWLLLFSQVKQTTVSSQSVTALEAFEADYNQENEREEENVEQFFEDCESRPLRTRIQTHIWQCAFLISVPLDFFCEIVMCSLFVQLHIM